MAQDNRPFQFEDIPEFAMKPARSAEDEFDPGIYERLFYDLPALEPQEAEIPFIQPIEEKDANAHESQSFDRAEVLSVPEGALEPEAAAAMDSAQQEVQVTVADSIETAEGAVLAEQPQEQPGESEAAPSAESQEPSLPSLERDASQLEKETQPTAISLENYEKKEDIAGIIEMPVTTPPSAGNTKIMPVIGSVQNSRLRVTDIKYKPVFRVFVEEDILVPDVKPDLAEILSVNGKLKLSEPTMAVGAERVTAQKINGDFTIQTLYIPQKPEENPRIINIDSRIPFKEELEIQAEPYSAVQFSPVLESLEYSVINERKFRIKATVALKMREYQTVDVEVFDGIQDDGVQLLKDKIQLTDVACRKTEAMELEEELLLKEPLPQIGKVLSHDISIVENHKQVGRDKAVINALVYCNVMYLSGQDTEEEKALPLIYQGKTEFTQFVKLDDKEKEGDAPTGSRISFIVNNSSVSSKTDESGQTTGFLLNMNVDTAVEVYRTKEKEVVKDIYHQAKEMQHESSEVSLMNLCGSGMCEVSAREVLNVPEKYKGVERVAFISGNIGQTKSTIESGRCIVEGVVGLTLICIGADDDSTAFRLNQDLPFRSVVEIPGVRSDMTADYEIQLKELWFDKMNARQIEVNAGVLVTTSAMSTEKYRLIQSVSFVETAGDPEEQPGMVLYITGKEDDLWSIAKKYRTTIDTIKKINHVDYSGKLQPGTKLLIVK